MSPDTPDTTRSAQEQRPCWFVGASFGGKDDQTERFVKEKIWETNKDKAKRQIQDAKAGDRIAIKAAYTRKNGIPFDCNGRAVSVMAIKATGTSNGTSILIVKLCGGSCPASGLLMPS